MEVNNSANERANERIREFIARNENCSLSGMRVAVAKVIITSNLEGNGTEKDPSRYVDRCWDLEGNLLFEKDPIKFNGSALKAFWRK